MAQLVGSNSLGLGKLINGKNQFVHIMYSANVDGSNMTVDIQANTKYIGIATSNSETAPINPSNYSWGRFVGTSGTSSYTWLRYSPNEDGSNMTVNPTSETKYIGVAITADNNAPTDYTKYSWALIKGDDGRGISKTEVTYQKSTSGTVIPTGTWVSTIPTVNAGEYLWTRTLFTYTDDTTSSTYSVARNGITGLGISKSDIDYQKSTSGTVAPTGAWIETIPTVTENEYLWTRTTLTYTNATTSVSYSVGKMGADGKDAKLLYLTASSQVQAFDKDNKPKTTQAITISAKLQNASGTATFVAIPYIGNIAQTAITLGGTGNNRTLLPSQWTNTQWTTIAITATLGSLTDTISVVRVKDGDTGATGKDGVAGKDGVGLVSTQVMYAGSDSGTVKPTTGWTETVPTLAAGKYLWTETTWLYSDNTGEAGYSVSRIGKDGNTGKDGIAGKDGVGISNTVIEYVGAVSGTSKPTSGWSPAIPTVPQGQYLWTRTTWTYTDGTKEQGYSAALMGPKGDKGDTGDDGQTPVVHPAWSWSPDGTDRFTTAYPGENVFLRSDARGFTSRGITAVFDKATGIATVTGTTTGAGDLWGVRGSAKDYNPAGKYTYSAEIIEGTFPTGIGLNVAIYSEGKWSTNYSTNGNPVLQFTANTNGVRDLGFRSYAAGISVNFKAKIKLESGYNDSPIYTPAPSDDYANAYPLYEGTYTDYSETASQNPADYTWRRIIGESGQDGATGPQGPQGITGPKGEDGKQYYTWLKYADSPTTGMSDSPTNKKYMGLAYNKITATESTNYADYTWSLIQGPQGNQGIQGPAGANGQPTYTWIKYGTSASGAGLSDDPTGKTYIGVAYNKTTATESTNAADYTWSLIQGPKGDTGPQGPAGPKGDRGVMGVAYMQPTQPADTTEGATWFKTESTDSDKIIGVYTYKSGWQPKKYASAALAVEDLSALSANLGNVTAGNITGVNINGSRFVNESDYGNTGTEIHAITTVAGNISMEWQSNVGTSNGLLTIYPDFLQSDMYSDAAKKQRVGTWSLGNGGLTVGQGNPGVSTFKGAAIGPNGIGITDPRYAPKYGEVSLSYQDLMTLPTVGIPAASGWTQYATSGGNRPTATRNGRLVQLAGSFKNSVVIPAGESSVMGTIPVGYRPAQRCNFLMQGSGGNIYLMYVNTNGIIEFARYRSGSSYVDCNVGSWLNIACSFVAGDI